MSEDLNRLVSLAQETLERLQMLLPHRHQFDWSAHGAAVWHRTPAGGELRAHTALDGIELSEQLHIDAQTVINEQNTRQFVRGLPANNVLLWGARGTGKSSLIHALLNRYRAEGLRLVEVDKEALTAFADIVDYVRRDASPVVLLSDDVC